MKQGSVPTPAHFSSHFSGPGFFTSSVRGGSAQRLRSCGQHPWTTVAAAPAKGPSFSRGCRALRATWSGLPGLGIGV